MRKHGFLGLLVLVIALAAVVAAGCGGDDDEAGGTTTATETDGGTTGAVSALPASSCAKLEFGGEGDPDVLIASDLPRQGASRLQTTQMTGAIRYVLEQRGWKAGEKNVAYQDCDDATAQAGKWDSGKCSQNANAYAPNENLVAVLGTFNSGCAQIIIPVLNQAPGGGLLLFSAANTYGCLTEPCAGNEPEKYYPTEKRNYARVAPSDPNQAAVVAEFAKSKGVKSVYILNDKEAYGLGVATNFRGAAKAAGIKVLGFAAYDGRSASYEALFTKIKATDPDGIFVGGLIDENGAQLVNDKVAVLGPNANTPAEGVMLFLPDGFTTDAMFQPKEGGTPKARGAFFSVAGAPIDEFKGKGGQFAKKFQTDVLKGKPVDPYAILAAQTAEFVLDAIENSDGTRASVIDYVFATDIQDGLIGSFSINENGDLTGASGAAVKFTIYRGTDKLESIVRLTEPDPKLTEAARKEAAG